MANFKQFTDQIHARYAALQKDATEFFVVDVPDLYQEYLGAFPIGTNNILREKAEHDCNTCKHFIRNLGKVVTIKDGKVSTIWDVEGLEEPYATVASELNRILQEAPIAGVFRTKFNFYGGTSNVDNHDPSIRWFHFGGKTPARCLKSSPEADAGQVNSIVGVFQRGLDEITLSDLDEVLDLINQNALYRGKEFEKSIQEFRRVKAKYLETGGSPTFAWEHCNSPAAGFRNTVIGTLFTDLAAGDGIEVAVKKYEAKVAPANYKRPTALITPKMIEQAVEKLKGLGLEDAIRRRLARLEDLSVRDVLFVDNTVAGVMKDKDDLTDLLLSSPSTKKRAPKSATATDISIADFIKGGFKNIELVLGNQHLSNFVTLTAPEHDDVKPLFKWRNNFAWSYDGEVTDSIRQRVEKAGGNVHDAKLRVSLAWSNYDDLDIHAFPPSGGHIFYGNKSGVLDVDMNAGYRTTREPVENLSWRSIQDGIYKISVNQFAKRESADVGFTLQVEFDGKTYEYAHPQAVVGTVDCLELTIDNGKLSNIKASPKLQGGGAVVVEKWGVTTGVPVKVQTVLLSPNHWEGAGEVGNKHWFFILENCKVDVPVRGIYNEFLVGDLTPHRKVFEVLGSKTKCQPTDKQLSGVGFSETRSDVVTAIADGRPYNVHF